jgi:hypothetical protein
MSARPRPAPLAAVLVAAALLASAPARAQALSVGIYAPTLPFDGPVARLDYVSRLATHLAEVVGEGSGVGRAYGRAADFAAAVKAGELQYAVVDAAYAAASGYAVIGQGLRGGASAGAWAIVTSLPAKSVRDLGGRTLAVPDVGARQEAFVYEVLLEGELAKGHFAQIIYAPDALSALAQVSHGRADAALIPAGLTLPAGVHAVAGLSSIPWPVVVALPGAPTERTAKVAEALGSFVGDAVLGGFQRGGGEAVRALAGRFGHRVHRGPFAVPSLRLAVDALLAGRSFRIPQVDPMTFIEAPPIPE